MSTSEARHSHSHSHGDNPGSTQPHDPIEDVVHAVPLVLPIAGGVLMFLLAFIAIYMA
ncbi:MAG TPA: hypothetical protein VHA82_02130 [Ramlibacter sp.]|uniref:hypothetical protein n=1 Tax=Ramlibacter sp. TaxID=1917967 RepID=UPI002C59E509|nr:hypothetical protein [Ramlibacter sp.]HVZ42579.1 hypothetical protein [Ramlibacter sp.]